MINGQSNTLLINVSNYPGFILNNNPTYTNIIIKNLIINPTNSLYTLANYSGWICQAGFCNGTISFCNTNGIIPENGGGICGSQSYNCEISNCFSTGEISLYGGGILGSYTQNCNVSKSYSIGLIGSYAGGIFGFGTNYSFDGSSYSPSSILDQDGNQINLISNPSVGSSLSSSLVTASYSMGGCYISIR